jgi:SET domain-containing protein
VSAIRLSDYSRHLQWQTRFPNKEIFIETLKEIDEGKELAIDYMGVHGETSFRRKTLKDIFGFVADTLHAARTS